MHRFLFLLLLASLPLPASILYTVNRTIGPGSVTGTITTDGTIGTIFQENILAYDLTISDGSQTSQLNKTLPKQGVNTPGSQLTATATQLLFNFHQVGSSYVYFYDDNSTNYWCLDDGNCAGISPGEGFRVGASEFLANYQGVQVIGTADVQGVPEPTTAALVAAAGIFAWSLRRSR